MVAADNHWRRLIAVVVLLMLAAWLAPRWIRAPDLDERRVLASRPEMPRHFQDLAAFRTATDAYVADRFGIRPHLIGAINRIRMVIGISGAKRVLIGRDGWLFYDDDSLLGPARGTPAWSAAQSTMWLDALAGRREYLQAKGIPYVLLVPPMKEAIYPQFAPGWFRLDPQRPAVRMANLARQTGAGDVLYIYDPIAKATAHGVKTYSLHDTHWTGEGAYYGYVALMEDLHRRGLAEAPRPRSDFKIVTAHPLNKPRNLALMLGVSSFVDIDFPELEDPVAEARIRTTYLTGVHDWTGPRIIQTGETGKPVLLMTLDSFSNALLPFLYGHFSRIVLAHNQDGPWRPDLIERFKPDVVVLEVLESGIGFSLEPAPAATAIMRARIDRAIQAADLISALPLLTSPRFGRRRAMASAARASNCNFDRLNLTRGEYDDGLLDVGGWLSDRDGRNTDPAGFVRLESRTVDLVAPIRVDGARPDVAAFFKNPVMSRTGFSAQFRSSNLNPGAYAIWVYRKVGGGWIFCKSARSLIIGR